MGPWPDSTQVRYAGARGRGRWLLAAGPLSTMHRVVFLDRGTVDATFRAPLFEHEWIEHLQTRPEQILERLRGATIAITNKVPLSRPVLEACSRLRLVAVAATGLNVVDLEACGELGIAVTHVRNYANRSVPEHALLLMLALRRNLLAYRRDVETGAWQRSNMFCLLTHTISDLFGACLGVIGYGALGKAMADLGRALGMHVLVAERKGSHAVREGRTRFEGVLEGSDVLTLHAPLTEETKHMIGPAELERMRRGAILINTARGALIDEAALALAIRSGHLGGVGIDVLEHEPPTARSPLMALAPRDDVIITPHVAWASRASMQALADQLVENLEAFERGEPRNLAPR